MIRRLLTRSGHPHLLQPEGIDSDLSDESENASFSRVRLSNCDIEDYVDAEVKRCLQSHVEKIANENYNLLYDVLRDHQQELRDQIDDGRSEIRMETDECMREIEQTRQESIDQLEGRSQQCLDYIQDHGIASTGEKVAKFKRSLLRRRYRHRRLYGLPPATPKSKYLMPSHTKRRVPR